MAAMQAMKPLPSRARLRKLFVYDAATGDLRWKSLPPTITRVKAGEIAGSIGHRDYRIVGIDRTTYSAHRIIWKMVTGEDPTGPIDHKDGDRLNNRFENLRPASNAQNCWNAKLSKRNRSGAKGVCWDASRNAWIAYIATGHRRKQLGRFESFQDAAAARHEAAKALHGEFARLA